LERFHGFGRDTLYKLIYYFLDHYPSPKPISNSSCRLVIDGTWFGRNRCLVVYWDTKKRHIQWWRLTTGERAFEITEDLKNLETQGVVCVSITSDGGGGIGRAVRTAYPNIPHQRCVIHIQRQVRSLVTLRPRSEAGKELSLLIAKLSKISDSKQRGWWLKRFEDWSKRWDTFLKERSFSDDKANWWYTHKQLRRAKVVISNALSDTFHYLEDSKIPKTSNELEGRFSSLKRHYGSHRGLSSMRLAGYIAWYLTVVVNVESPTRNQ